MYIQVYNHVIRECSIFPGGPKVWHVGPIETGLLEGWFIMQFVPAT